MGIHGGFKIYLVTDRRMFADEAGFLAAIEETLKSGISAVQLREKDLKSRELLSMAYTVRDLTRRYGAKLFVNDRVDIALAVDADGVQLGVSSIPAYAVRKASGGRLLTGVSTHGLSEAQQAERDGADFITLGPIYDTPSKQKYGRPLGTDAIRLVHNNISLPIFAIGGIRQDRVAEVMNAGAEGIALISAILAADDIKSTTETFVRLLG